MVSEERHSAVLTARNSLQPDPFYNTGTGTYKFSLIAASRAGVSAVETEILFYADGSHMEFEEI